jgi:hypothetical protein
MVGGVLLVVTHSGRNGRDVKTSGNNVRGCIGRGRNVLGRHPSTEKVSQ